MKNKKLFCIFAILIIIVLAVGSIIYINKKMKSELKPKKKQFPLSPEMIPNTLNDLKNIIQI